MALGSLSQRGTAKVTESPMAVVEQLLIGSSLIMQQLRALILRVSASRLPMLIEGSTGVGKELVATALHLSSNRTGPFVAFNVCAIAESVFEDALFGHVRGAFTGALRDASGYMAEANGGTLFLDEINGLPLIAQAKLLRAVETGVFRPVGAQRDRVSDFRLIAATNSNLSVAVSAGMFRRDLLYRISGLTIRVPALSERSEDIPELVQHFLMNAPTDARLHLRPEAINRLQQHSWPGNVRELKHVIERLTVVCESRVATASDVSAAMGRYDSDGDWSVARTRERLCMLDILQLNHWDTARVAKQIGVNRTTIYRRMVRLGITPPRFQGGPRVGEEAPISPATDHSADNCA